MYKIEKGIEIPPSQGIATKMKYPFYKMEQGDSFFVPLEIEDTKKNSSEKHKELKLMQGRIIRSFYAYKKSRGLTKKNFGISTRILSDGVRCWRIK